MASPQDTNDRAARPLPTAPTTLSRWFPIAEWLPKYQWNRLFRADLIAAVSVAALVIPESMGLATVAGVPVQIGLYAAPLALIGYAMFGGSKLLVFAVSGSVAAVSASVVGELSAGDQDTAVALTAALALTTGAVFIVAGLARLGFVANFMSNAVMTGFIIGLSIQIIIGQLGELLGIEQSGGSSVTKLWSAISQIGDWNPVAVIMGVGALVLMLGLKRFAPKLPGALIAVVASSLIVAIFDPDLELVAAIPQGIPSISLPTGIDASTWGELLLGGAVVALVAFSEGWGTSQTLASRTHVQLNANQEFRAYGVGNIGAGLLGGMVVTGSLGKSIAAEEDGAKTQMSNIILAGIVLLTLALLAPAFQWLPEAVLAAIVIDAMLDSASLRKLNHLWGVDKVDYTLGLVTMVLVLALDLLPAIVAGIVLSIVYMVYRISFPGRALLGRVPETGDYVVRHWLYGRRHGEANPHAQAVPGVLVYRFAGPLVFSNAEAFGTTGQAFLVTAGERGELPHTVVIDFEEVLAVDVTGAAALQSFIEYAARYGVNVTLARVHSGTRELLGRSGVLDEIGEDRLFATVRGAVDAATTGQEGGAGAT